MFFLPPARLEVPVSCATDAPPFPRGRPVKVLVWNVQYAAGRKRRFFYDGGPDVLVPAEEVVETLDRIAAVVRAADPDVVLWQELDRGSRRTGHLDQLAELQRRLDYPCQAATPYHRAPWVPHPAHQHLGRVDMSLAVTSRFQLASAVRWQLPLLHEPAWRRLFNLRRALLEVRVPLEGGGEVVLFDTHLSAFSRGDGTLQRQVATLREHAERAEGEGLPWLLAGDFNSLAPGDHPDRLPAAERPLYAEAVTPVQPLFDRFASGAPVAAYRADPQPLRTYVPHGAAEADRTLDYLFHGSRLVLRRFEVLHGHGDVSDHLPMLAEVEVEEGFRLQASDFRSSTG